MAIAEVSEFIDYLQLDKRDFLRDAFELYNDDSDASTATVKVSPTQLTLVKTGGSSPGTRSITLADYPTLTELVAEIEGNSDSWTAYLLARGTAASTDLYPIGSTSALTWDSRAPIEIVNNLRLGEILDVAQALIEKLCHRHFEDADYSDELYDGNGTQFLTIRNAPVSSVSGITYVTGAGDSITETEIDDDTYYIQEDQGILVRTGDDVWYWGIGNYKLSYNAGYADVPDDVKEMVLEVAAQLYYKAARDPMVRSERLSTHSRTFTEMAMTPQTWQKVRLWQRRFPYYE